MKISVPVIADVDVLLLGGTLEGCRKAVELAGKGHSVFAAAGYSHFGEEVRATPIPRAVSRLPAPPPLITGF